MIVTVTLNPAIDVIAPIDSLIPDAVLRSKKISRYPGGKGTNTARALAAMAAAVTATGFCAKANLAEMNSFLRKYRVRPDFTAVAGSNRLCLLISGKKHETVINSESSLVINAKQRAAFLNKIKTLSLKTSVFVFSGSLPLCLPPAFYAACIKTVKINSKVILDAHSGGLREGIKAGPHIVKANMQEFESAFGVKLKTPASLKRFITRLSDKYGIKTIIVTLGKKGSVLFENGLFSGIKPFKVKNPASSAGCGDAYSAGLAFGIEKGLNMAACCRLGSAAAAANLASLGACFITKKEILGFLPDGF